MKDFNFGENLRLVRISKGLSQEAVATALNMSQSTYSRLERDPKIPKLELVESLVRMLEVEPAILLSGRGIEDLMPKDGLKHKVKELLSTPIGIGFYCFLVIPFVNAAYDMGDGFCEGYGTTDEVRKCVRFMAGLAAIFFAYYWMRKIRKSKD